MYCYNCGKELDDDARFCVACGANQRKSHEQTCLVCGHKNRHGGSICHSCLQPLDIRGCSDVMTKTLYCDDYALNQDSAVMINDWLNSAGNILILDFSVASDFNRFSTCQKKFITGTEVSLQSITFKYRQASRYIPYRFSYLSTFSVMKSSIDEMEVKMDNWVSDHPGCTMIHYIQSSYIYNTKWYLFSRFFLYVDETESFAVSVGGDNRVQKITIELYEKNRKRFCYEVNRWFQENPNIHILDFTVEFNEDGYDTDAFFSIILYYEYDSTPKSYRIKYACEMKKTSYPALEVDRIINSYKASHDVKLSQVRITRKIHLIYGFDYMVFIFFIEEIPYA